MRLQNYINENKLQGAIDRRNINPDGTLPNGDEPTPQNVKRLLDRRARPSLKENKKKLKEVLVAAKKDPKAGPDVVRKYDVIDSRLTNWKDLINQLKHRIAGGEQYIKDLELAAKLYKK